MNTQIQFEAATSRNRSLDQHLSEIEFGPELTKNLQRRLLAIKATDWLESNSGSSERLREASIDDIQDEDRHISTEQFIHSLSELRLITDSESKSYKQSKMDAKAMSSHLIGLKVLTRYQAKMLLSGRPQHVSIGNYLVLEQIGAGGMGSVFLAIHRHMNRVVALKVISPHLPDSESKVSRFNREIHISGVLDHPNIVTAYDADRHGNNFFLAMEFVSGNHLGQLIQDKEELSIVRAIDIVQQAAEGLQHAHERNVIHRDVKPSNILVSIDGDIKVADLGVATLQTKSLIKDTRGRSAEPTAWSSTNPEDTLTGCSDLLGTLSFMAPEQADNPKTADERSDIYSLGCTLYFALTGRVPFPREFPYAVIYAHEYEARPLPSALRAGINPAIDELVQQMMAPNPADRPSSMANVVGRLKHIRQRLNISACHSISQTISKLNRSPTRARFSFRQRRVRLAAFMSLLVAVSFAATDEGKSQFFFSERHVAAEDKKEKEELLAKRKAFPTSESAASSRFVIHNRRKSSGNQMIVPEPAASASTLFILTAFLLSFRRKIELPRHPRPSDQDR